MEKGFLFQFYSITRLSVMVTQLQKPTLALIAILTLAFSGVSQASSNLPSYDRKFYNLLMGKGLPKNGNRWPMAKGSVWTGISMGSKLSVYPQFGSISGYPLYAFGDYSYSDHMSIGGYFGYYRGNYQVEYGVNMYESQLQSFVGGARLTFHFADVFNRLFLEVVNVKKVDLYSTLHAGFVQYNWNVDPLYQFHKDYSPVNKPSAGLVVGLRYLPHSKVGIHVEVGKGVYGNVSFGVAYKIVK